MALGQHKVLKVSINHCGVYKNIYKIQMSALYILMFVCYDSLKKSSIILSHSLWPQFLHLLNKGIELLAHLYC